MSDQSVFASLMLKKNGGKARIPATAVVSGTGDEMTVSLVFLCRDLAKAQVGDGARKSSVGFSLIPVEVDLPEGTFLLSSPWVSISAR